MIAAQAPFWAGFLLSLSLCFDLGLVNAAVLKTATERGGGAGFLVGLGRWGIGWDAGWPSPRRCSSPASRSGCSFAGSTG